MRHHHAVASKPHLTCPASLLGRAAAQVAGRTAELSSISDTRRCSEDSSDAIAATASVTFFCMSAMMRGAVFCCSLSACAPPALESQMRLRPQKLSAASDLQKRSRQVVLSNDITNCVSMHTWWPGLGSESCAPGKSVFRISMGLVGSGRCIIP